MAKLAVHTMPNEGGGWKNMTEGQDEIIITFNTKAEAQAAARVRARRLRCEHIMYDLDGAVVARSSFGNHVYPRTAELARRHGSDSSRRSATASRRCRPTRRG